ncbi:penicillin-insensitive murein endopeptidase [Roseococcus sp. SYP-B2431]|uniref:penicillin-insensitive murein endopeptidase n=1 Tax=Roseococcus sp. SYP-B2431 TaxID=2496640 RepID=UPI001F0FFE1A|nr:penicillin-insensitive murein endopeptidase [Roseococcus sp. SYP-B2431]
MGERGAPPLAHPARKLVSWTFLAWVALLLPAHSQTWSTVRGPSPGPARVIGGTGLGCIAGAVELPPEGPGYQAVRLSRNRNWGHPDLVRFVQTFAARSGQDLWIGDLGQPRGGPMPFGHASHQAGIDADIWLDLSRKPAMSRPARESIPETSLVLPDQSAVDPRRFTEAHARLIRLAAETPGVERIFVNHGIKRSLCAMHRGEAWLHRVRPWFGHDSHMHVRLRCPAGSPECRPGPPIPAGDGCDGLDWWLSEAARRPTPRPPGPRPQLPAACAALLRLP